MTLRVVGPIRTAVALIQLAAAVFIPLAEARHAVARVAPPTLQHMVAALPASERNIAAGRRLRALRVSRQHHRRSARANPVRRSRRVGLALGEYGGRASRRPRRVRPPLAPGTAAMSNSSCVRDVTAASRRSLALFASRHIDQCVPSAPTSRSSSAKNASCSGEVHRDAKPANDCVRSSRTRSANDTRPGATSSGSTGDVIGVTASPLSRG